MMENILCVGMIAALLFLYWMFGKMAVRFAGAKLNQALCLLFGACVYHGLFQILALPLILLKQPLSMLTIGWMGVIGIVGMLWLAGEYRLRRKKRCAGENGTAAISAGTKTAGAPVISGGTKKTSAAAVILGILAVTAVLIQMYYVISSPYLGFDTASYVGTIGTSVSYNSMYLYDGERGTIEKTLSLRYALSSFYMHAAVWCQLLKIRAVSYAKIVQAGVLPVLANTVIFELGRFLFSGKRYAGKLQEGGAAACGAAMVLAAVALNFFYQSMYTTSDFLINRALEAKAYCGNFVLPFLFLLCLFRWREDGRPQRLLLFAAMFASVPFSMSALVSAPALVTLMTLPRLWRERSWRQLRFYVLCMLPNALYLTLYVLHAKNIFRIGI